MIANCTHKPNLPDCEKCQEYLMAHIYEDVNFVNEVRKAVRSLDKVVLSPISNKDKKVIMKAALLHTIKTGIQLEFMIGLGGLSNKNQSIALELCNRNKLWEHTTRELRLINLQN